MNWQLTTIAAIIIIFIAFTSFYRTWDILGALLENYLTSNLISFFKFLYIEIVCLSKLLQLLAPFDLNYHIV